MIFLGTRTPTLLSVATAREMQQRSAFKDRGYRRLRTLLLVLLVITTLVVILL